MEVSNPVANAEYLLFDLKYVPGEGNPKRIFQTMIHLIDAVELTGTAFLKGIDPSLSFRIGVKETGSGSLLTKAVGLVFGKDGKQLPAPQEAELAQGVASATKEVFRAQRRPDLQGHVDPKEITERLADLQRETAQAYTRAIGDSVPVLIAKPISERQMQAIFAELATGAFFLEPKDSLGVTINDETFGLNPALKPYDINTLMTVADADPMAVIESGTGPKVIRVLTPRYGKKKGWEIVHQDRIYRTEVNDNNWYERIHEQFEEVGPKDQLLVEAEFEMHKTPTGRDSGTCRILRVISKKKYDPDVVPNLEGFE